MKNKEVENIVAHLRLGCFIRSHITTTGANAYRLLDSKINPIANVSAKRMEYLIEKKFVKKYGSIYVYNENQNV